MLSDEAKARYAEEGALLTELEGFVRSYEERFRESFTAAEAAALSIEDKVTLLLSSALASARQLTWSMVHAVNGHLAPALFLSTRAHFELTGLVAYLLRDLRRYCAGTLPAAEFEALLVRLHLGRLHGLKALAPELAAQVKAVWVGKLIEAVDDVFLEGADLKLFKDCYGWLSEFCHPNSFARQVVGMRLEGRTVRFDHAAGLTVEEVGTALGHAEISWVRASRRRVC